MQQFIMHILIDGYNLIRQSADLRRFERQNLEAGRKALIAWLAQYRRLKGHRITVIFDGWKSGQPQEERDYSDGIHMVYSALGVKADDIIKRITASSDEEILVVSSDRDITSFAARRGQATLSSPEFESIVNHLLAEPTPNGHHELRDEEEEDRPINKKGPSRKLSRAKRRAQIKIRKL